MMTANLTVQADVWACRQPGVPLVAAIVEGEHASDYIDRTNVVNPPAWLVALRDARCETCEGLPFGHPWQRPHPDDRPDCHGTGRLLHDVRVECGTSVEWPDGGIGLCDLCFGTGYRTVRCLVDLAEIRSNEAGDACCDKDDHLDVIGDGTVQTMFDGYDDELETTHVEALAAACGKPPTEWPGMYAVILTTTDQEAE